jgi:hypothetical protein
LEGEGGEGILIRKPNLAGADFIVFHLMIGNNKPASQRYEVLSGYFTNTGRAAFFFDVGFKFLFEAGQNRKDDMGYLTGK